MSRLYHHESPHDPVGSPAKGHGTISIVDPHTKEEVATTPRKLGGRRPVATFRPASPDSGSSESSSRSDHDAIRSHASRVLDSVRSATAPVAQQRVTIAKILSGAVNVPPYLVERTYCSSELACATVDHVLMALRIELAENGPEPLIYAHPVRSWACLDEWAAYLSESSVLCTMPQP
eukprot:c45636_g1_i1.p2 GENE.c45636_g1_i1~~c45636_g1_i1.p2  ORF type:complete len:177 (+),score=17.76 c45636_g1_i1:120-650(+)